MFNEDSLDTNTRKSREEIYKKIASGFTPRWMRDVSKDMGYAEEMAHKILDGKYGIDLILKSKFGHQYSVQEKVRSGSKLKYTINGFPEILIKYKRALGLTIESENEYFRNISQLYAYFWAKKDNIGIETWVIWDVFQFNQLVEKAGGIDKLCNGDLFRPIKESDTYCFKISLEKILPICIYKADNIDNYITRPIRNAGCTMI